MTTHEIYIIEPSTSEEAKALKAFAKALKMKITKKTDIKTDIKTELSEAIDNLNLIKEGKLEAKPARTLLNEL